MQIGVDKKSLAEARKTGDNGRKKSRFLSSCTWLQ